MLFLKEAPAYRRLMKDFGFCSPGFWSSAEKVPEKWSHVVAWSVSLPATSMTSGMVPAARALSRPGPASVYMPSAETSGLGSRLCTFDMGCHC